MVAKDLPLSQLVEADYNPRYITEHDFRALRESLRKFGPVDPLIVNSYPGRENIIIGGHQRRKAAMAEGYAVFPCVIVHLDPELEIELNARLNRGGKWDYEKLANLHDVETLMEWGFAESELLGKIAAEDRDAEKKEKEGEENKSAGAGSETDRDSEGVTVEGDIWIMGNHRIVCGDCRVKTVTDLLFSPGEKEELYSSNLIIENNAQDEKILVLCLVSRRFYRGMAIDPEVVDRIVKKWQKETYDNATHGQTGHFYNDMKKDD